MRKRNVQILFRLTEEEAEQRRLYEEEQELPDEDEDAPVQ